MQIFCRNSFIICYLLFIIQACNTKKDDVYVNPVTINNVGNVPSTFTYNFLIEQFTSENSISAVNGNDTLQAIKNIYSTRAVIASLHQNDSLELTYYYQLKNILGPISGFPRACINRLRAKVGSQIDSVVFSSYEWRKNIEAIKNDTATCGIAMSNYELNNIVTVNVFVGNNTPIVGDSFYLSVYLIENEVAAINQLGAPSNYKHPFVLRKVITLGQGEPIKLTNSTKYVQKEFRSIDVSAYNKNNVKIIAFVHKKSDNYKMHNVLNSLECGINETVKWN